MKRDFEIMFTIILLWIVYLILSLVIDLPLPGPYKRWRKEVARDIHKNDPLTNVGGMFLKVVGQRDSLQKIVDSCKCN
jgi:hypothetical protein